VPRDQIKAVQVDVLEFKPRADVVVEQRQLVAQLAERILDRGGQSSSAARCFRALGFRAI